MTLHDRTTKSLLHLHKKKKPPSISAQFQVGGPAGWGGAELCLALTWLGQSSPSTGRFSLSPAF